MCETERTVIDSPKSVDNTEQMKKTQKILSGHNFILVREM